MAQDVGEAPPETRRRSLSPRVRIIAAVVTAVVVLGGILYWLPARNFEETDDAQIDGHLNPISAKVDGTVLQVSPELQDNRFVQAGTVLVQLDPATYQAELDRAQVEVTRLEASAAAARAQVPVTSANA